MKSFCVVLFTVAYFDLSTSSPFWASSKAHASCVEVDPSPCYDVPAPPPQCHAHPAPCAHNHHAHHVHPVPCAHKHRVPCSPIVTKVKAPGRIVIKEAPHVIPEYVESAPLVLKQEAAPRWVFGDTAPIRLTHSARPATIEHFETPYIIDAHQKASFINHAAHPVVIDHYETPTVVRDEGLPPLIQPCECEVDVPCKFDVPCDCDLPCH
ncbi:unnamed protein product [Bemisia tabaci]|uniref:Uncharacterized protein n=1 Tax=Bemisia tabaci TaxID=7038 RepID=A0A9P0EWM3_BEMTA|nr:unnamed protein product [Bemisia tabaci]